MTNRTRTRVARICLAALAVGAAASIGTTTIAAADAAPRSRTASTFDTSPRSFSVTDTALEALTAPGSHPATDRALIPPLFTQQFYEPVIENGLLVAPDGDCSSPIPLPSEFETACKAHDLGYDLLRFGESPSTTATAVTATATARRLLDDRLGQRMHDACRSRTGIGSRSTCTAMADIATAAVRFNTWRQHYGTPNPEPALPYLLAASAGVGLLGVALSLRVPLLPRVAASAVIRTRVREVAA